MLTLQKEERFSLFLEVIRYLLIQARFDSTAQNRDSLVDGFAYLDFLVVLHILC